MSNDPRKPKYFGGAGRFSDAVYDRNAPGMQSAHGDAYVSGSGYSSNEERLLTEALATQTAQDPDSLRAMRPSFARGRNPFPPRFGYAQGELTISDVVNVDRRYPDSSAEFSGTSGGFAGTMSPSLGWW